MVSTMVRENQKDDENNSNSSKEVSKDVYVITQEIKMIKSLAGNDPKVREKQLKKLAKWFNIRAKSSFAFTDDDFLRIWKGLYYCMWMSDKPLVQESLADNLGSLIDCFENINVSIQFFGAFLKTMSLEWFSIDQWRMDKFLMLIRKMFRYMFYAMKNNSWSKDSIEQLSFQLSSTVLDTKVMAGLPMHVADVFLEELGKVAGSDIPGELVAELIKPFVIYVARHHDLKLMGYVKNRIFYHWLWQSDRGREYSEKFNAWKEMGFPTESINDLEKVEEEVCEDSETEKSVPDTKNLDPRAGNVDVFVPELPVNVSPIIALLESIQYKDITNTKSRKILRIILNKYKAYEKGEFPLGIKKIYKPQLEPMKPLVKKKVVELENLENELYSTSRKLKKLSKKKRKKLLASIDFNNVTEDNFEEVLESVLPGKKRPHSDDWLEEEIEIPRKVNKVESKVRKDVKNVEEADNNVSNDWLESLQTKENDESKENTKQNSTQANDTSAAGTKTMSEWDKPLEDGEIEYYVPSRKIKLKEANKEHSSQTLVLNPFAKKNKKNITGNRVLLGKSMKAHKKPNTNEHSTALSKEKKVKIVLQKNTAQKPSDYIKQVKSSPQLPYDSRKQPVKSLLKPNLLPSPINPFYKKKIGLKIDKP